MDKHNTETEVQLNQLRHEILALEEEVNHYKDSLETIEKRIQDEKELIDYYSNDVKHMRTILIEETVDLYYLEIT